MNVNGNATLDVDVDGTKPHLTAADSVGMLIEFLAVALEIIADLPKGHSELAS